MTVTEGQRSIAGGIERASEDKSYPANAAPRSIVHEQYTPVGFWPVYLYKILGEE